MRTVRAALSEASLRGFWEMWAQGGARMPVWMLGQGHDVTCVEPDWILRAMDKSWQVPRIGSRRVAGLGRGGRRLDLILISACGISCGRSADR